METYKVEVHNTITVTTEDIDDIIADFAQALEQA